MGQSLGKAIQSNSPLLEGFLNITYNYVIVVINQTNTTSNQTASD